MPSGRKQLVVIGWTNSAEGDLVDDFDITSMIDFSAHGESPFSNTRRDAVFVDRTEAKTVGAASTLNAYPTDADAISVAYPTPTRSARRRIQG